MIVNKAYKFRLYPTCEQEILINKSIGSSRFIYNHYLNARKEKYDKDKTTISLGEMKKDLKNLSIKNPWLKEIDSTALRTSLDDLDRGYINFFEGRSSYPKFKVKGVKESYRTTCIRSSYKGKNYSNIKLDLENKTIKLPKLGNVKIRGYRKLKDFPHKILNATISKEASKYYISVSVEELIIERPTDIRYIVGLDLGVKDLVVCSDGIKYKKLKSIRVQEKRIKGLQKALSRCVKGSNNSYKIKQKIQRAYQKIRNMRKYYIHLITTNLVKENDLIITEDLQVKKMIETKDKNNKRYHLPKEISNASFHEILRQIEYKCKWNSKKYIKVNKYYPSSQICSHCGRINKIVSDLSIREFECVSCGSLNDRDINAGINILTEGVRLYYKSNLDN